MKDKVINNLLSRIATLEWEIERLHFIIKEVRELLKNDYFEDGSFTSQEKVFEILDKENK